MKNTVYLIGYYGGDERHCLSAWQSTNIELGIELSPEIDNRVRELFDATVVTKKKSPQELLKYLAEHGHTSPFRKSYLDFQVTADIASHIHCIKHTVGTNINSESLRYKELEDKWYIPEDWNNCSFQPTEEQTLDNTGIADYFLGAWYLDKDDKLSSWGRLLDKYNELGHRLYHMATEQLTPVLGRQRAKESARYFLPYSKQLTYDMQMSFQAFVHFQKMRNSPYAQKEIREIAQYMLELVKGIEGNPFKYSLEAFDL